MYWRFDEPPFIPTGGRIYREKRDPGHPLLSLEILGQMEGDEDDARRLWGRFAEHRGPDVAPGVAGFFQEP